MTSFAENLALLPDTGPIRRLELIPTGTNGATEYIENVPGQAGSLRIYHALWKKYGTINKSAAAEGLQLFAEHATSARKQPGSHPNIDRLFAILRKDLEYTVHIHREEND